jgi:hypothetical protein
VPQESFAFDEPIPGPKQFNPICDTVLDGNNTLLVIKTGATEAFEKLPTHLITTLTCSKDFLIFSDLDQHMGSHTLHNVLSRLPEIQDFNNEAFHLYRLQQEYQRNGQDIGPLREKGNDDMEHNDAWNLDKYKFMPMLEQAYSMRPDYDWYVFLEADTYIVWPNLVRWLEQLDPTEPLYLGSPTYIADTGFAHGGSGIVISKAAMRKFVEDGDGEPGSNEHGINVEAECCGDYILELVFDRLGIKLGKHWPMFNGEKPITMPFGPTHWCQPIITMHHVTSEEVSSMWRFEWDRPDPSVRLCLLSFHCIVPLFSFFLTFRSEAAFIRRAIHRLYAKTFHRCPRRLG